MKMERAGTSSFFEDLEPGLDINLGTISITPKQVGDFFRLVGEDRMSAESDVPAPTSLLTALITERPRVLGILDEGLIEETDLIFKFLQPVMIHEELSASMRVTHRRLADDATKGVVGLHLSAHSPEGVSMLEGTASLTVSVRSIKEAREMEESRPSFASPGWLAVLLRSLSESKEFAEATSSFDGSIAINFGVEAIGLRLYKGRIIDQGRAAINAATFTIGATPSTWHDLAKRPRNEFISFAMSDAIQVQGSMYEYLRMTRALMVLTDEIRVLLGKGYSS
jgi:hypothetical protein